MATYSIVRFYFSGKQKTLAKGLTIEVAQAHCRNPETSSRTCTLPEGLRRTKKHGAWFDGYREENR